MTIKELKRHHCDSTKVYPLRDAKGEVLTLVCAECEEAKIGTYPMHRLMGETRPMEER